MTVTIKKAGEAVASKVIQTAGKAAAGAATREVKPPRAVNAAEAPNMIPARESVKTSMMPWQGWVDRFLKDKLNDNQYNMLKETFYFTPDDPDKMQQVLPPSAKTKYSSSGQEIAYREVSPGSQEPVDVPLHDLNDDPYDSGYFKRDTRRRYIDPEFPNPEVEKLKLDMQDPNDPDVQEAKEKLAAGPPSSPGNKNVFATGPSDFDPTGLRAVMAVTHAEIQKELDNHMPDHVSHVLSCCCVGKFICSPLYVSFSFPSRSGPRMSKLSLIGIRSEACLFPLEETGTLFAKKSVWPDGNDMSKS